MRRARSSGSRHSSVGCRLLWALAWPSSWPPHNRRVYNCTPSWWGTLAWRAHLKASSGNQLRNDAKLRTLATGSSSVNVMRNLVAAAVGKRLQKVHEELARQELPGDIKQALAQLKRLRWRQSWQHGHPPPARRGIKVHRRRHKAS